MFTCLQAKLDNSLVLAQPGSLQLFVLNPLAALVWYARRANVPTDEIATLVASQFDIPVKQVLADVQQITGQFERFPGQFNDAKRNKPAVTAATITAPDPLNLSLQINLNLAGTYIQLQVEDAALAGQIAPIVSHLQDEDSGNTHKLLLTGTAQRWQLAHDGHICEEVDTDAVVNVHHQLVEIACRSPEQLLVIHGAGLAREGQGILLIGAGGSGKTTLCAALNATGMELLSDDVVPLTPDGDLLGVGMSLCLKSGSWPVLEGHIAGLDELAVLERCGQRIKFVPPPGPVVQKPVRAGLFLFPKYQPDCEPGITALDAVGVLQEMIEAESLLLDLDQQRLDKLVEWVGSAPGYVLRYPDLDTGLAQVKGLMDNPTISGVIS